jgi:hypothetical protein
VIAFENAGTSAPDAAIVSDSPPLNSTCCTISPAYVPSVPGISEIGIVAPVTVTVPALWAIGVIVAEQSSTSHGPVVAVVAQPAMPVKNDRYTPLPAFGWFGMLWSL